MSGQAFFKLLIDQVSLLTIPLLIFTIVGYGMGKRVKVYESFVEGGKEGFNVFLQILPYIIAILVAIGLFRASGAMDYISELLRPATMMIGMPPETLPVALMRPLSGSGSLGLLADIVKADPDGYSSKVASTMFGSTDTTFYVIALYFGYVGTKKIRHALIAGLIADAAGILAAVWVCKLVFA